MRPQRGGATFCNRALFLNLLAILAFSKRRKSVKSTSSRVRDEFMSRKQPNILVTGTPGTGKTTTCQQVVEAIGFTHVNVGDWVKQHELHSGWDEEHDCYIIDEDKVSRVSDIAGFHLCLSSHQLCCFLPHSCCYTSPCTLLGAAL